jgi:hypothetical protein
MDRPIDRAIAHWKKTRGERRSLEVPEWGEGGKPMIVYWGAWTLGEQDRCADDGMMVQVGDKIGLRPLGFARVVCVKAEDENGSRLFKDVEERELLNEVQPAIVKRIGTVILADLNATHAAAVDPEKKAAAGEA